MPEIAPVSPSVPSFKSAELLQQGLEAKSNYEYVDLYPRDGSVALGEVEDRIAKLAGVEDGRVLAYSFGMNAVCAAIDMAVHLKSDGERFPTIACGQDTYSQTRKFLNRYYNGKRGKVLFF
jgi:cystathionine beta-lyase/cystathionine gamma-synthase